MTIHDVLALLWRESLISTLAISVVLALRVPVRRWLGARAGYLLWTLVPCAVLAASLPAPQHLLTAALQIAPAVVAAAPTIDLAASPATPAFDMPQWLLAGWIGGALSLLIVLISQQRRYLSSLGDLVADDAGALRARGQRGSPALVGALRPRIVLPFDFDTRFDARERELVLAHERVHLARGDAQINALIALLRCLNWFNPFFHFAASCLRFDQELACDAQVISRFPEARRRYADAMLKAQLVGEARQELRLPIGCYWPSTHPLKERIAMLKAPILSVRRRLLASTAIAVLTLGAGYASWAAQPGTAASANPDASRGQDAAAATGASGGDVAPSENLEYRRMRPPRYPPDAVKAHIQGKVMLKVQMDAEGVPLGTEVVSVEPKEAGVLADAAIAAAMQWRYKPGTKDGAAVGGYVLVPVDFSLEDAETHAPLPVGAPQSVVAASYRRLRPPQYPAPALVARVTGTVWVRARFNVKGAVIEAHAEQTYPLSASELADAAVAAVRGWTFNPSTVNGIPVEGEVVVPLRFAIDGYTPGESSEPVPAFPAQTPMLATVTVKGTRV